MISLDAARDHKKYTHIQLKTKKKKLHHLCNILTRGRFNNHVSLQQSNMTDDKRQPVDIRPHFLFFFNFQLRFEWNNKRNTFCMCVVTCNTIIQMETAAANVIFSLFIPNPIYVSIYKCTCTSTYTRSRNNFVFTFIRYCVLHILYAIAVCLIQGNPRLKLKPHEKNMDLIVNSIFSHEKKGVSALASHETK